MLTCGMMDYLEYKVEILTYDSMHLAADMEGDAI